MNHYETLGVDRDASQDDIKKQFRKRSHECHPDKGGDEGEFKSLIRAYETLGDSEKRKQYDEAPPEPMRVSPEEKIVIQVLQKAITVEGVDIIQECRFQIDDLIEQKDLEVKTAAAALEILRGRLKDLERQNKGTRNKPGLNVLRTWFKSAIEHGEYNFEILCAERRSLDSAIGIIEGLRCFPSWRPPAGPKSDFFDAQQYAQFAAEFVDGFDPDGEIRENVG